MAHHLPQGGPPIDIIFLVERLESLIANGKRLPLTNNVVVDQSGALDLIDQLRASVPEEVRQAKRISQETERIIANAQEEADGIIARAQEQAAFLIEERELTRAAELRSQEIIAEAEAQAEEVRRGADAYAVSVLLRLEGECAKALQSIQRGLALLDDRRGSADGQVDGEGDGQADGEPGNGQVAAAVETARSGGNAR